MNKHSLSTLRLPSKSHEAFVSQHKYLKILFCLSRRSGQLGSSYQNNRKVGISPFSSKEYHKNLPLPIVPFAVSYVEQAPNLFSTGFRAQHPKLTH